ncbi:MAG: hypothetical protein HKN04_15370 [Rhodothermaceae bacterium]|nr:hypothetical protein [Rhodothermaceae bacterium]
MDLIRDDSLRSALITYLDLNGELVEKQRTEGAIAEAAGQRIARRVDISEWLFATLPDSAREARSRLPDDVGIYPTGDWSPPIPLDAEAFYADPTMYASAWSLALVVGQIENTHRDMRESAAALRERIEAELDR